jgi:superfamily I DNA and/or RNA helicase
MGRDVFDLSGISTGSGETRRIHTDDLRLARITRQRRCAPQIWNNVAHLYDGVACRVNEEDLSAIAALPPRAGYSLMIDTSRAPTAACVRAGRSWQNPYTAKLTIAIVDAILKAASRDNRDLSVAIITPYRAQVKLLRNKLRELSTSSLWQRYRVTPGTIHQFQGSEADIVLFDMVDGPGRPALGALLRGDTGIRLVNVAITRARGKLILLINQSWCLQHMESEDNPLLWNVITRHSGKMRIQL